MRTLASSRAALLALVGLASLTTLTLQEHAHQLRRPARQAAPARSNRTATTTSTSTSTSTARPHGSASSNVRHQSALSGEQARRNVTALTSSPAASDRNQSPLEPRSAGQNGQSIQNGQNGQLVQSQSRQLAGSPGNISMRSHSLDDISHRLDGPEPNVTQDNDMRVPFWNIAHMINSIEQVELALMAGSNGIETDVSFDARGLPVEAYHGFPCDCGRHCHYREELAKFLRHLGNLHTPPAASRLQVVLLDLKLKDLKTDELKQTAGLALAELLYRNLYEPYERAIVALVGRQKRGQLSEPLAAVVQPPLRVVVSINHAQDIALVRAFIGFMRKHKLDFMSQQVGFDVGMNDNLQAISAAWDSLQGATFNIWQGDGLTNCANIVRGVERLKEAVGIRNGQGHFRKVYYWTADVMYHIRSVLRFGIDAVLTNQPQRVNQVLAEAEFRHKYRLATPWDNPFEQFWVRASAARLKPPTLGETVETLANIQKTSQNFIKTLPDGLTAVVKKVHQSIRRS